MKSGGDDTYPPVFCPLIYQIIPQFPNGRCVGVGKDEGEVRG